MSINYSFSFSHFLKPLMGSLQQIIEGSFCCWLDYREELIDILVMMHICFSILYHFIFMLFQPQKYKIGERDSHVSVSGWR